MTHDGRPDAPPQPAVERAETAEPRPMIERLGLGLIAVVVAVLFGALGVAALASNELFLGVMGLTGALMTVWAAVASLRKG